MRTWILQGRVDKYNIKDYLKKHIGGIIRWKVREHYKEMSIGDSVFIWRASGGNKDVVRGIIAKGKIVYGPALLCDDDKEKWLPGNEHNANKQKRVEIKLQEVRLSPSEGMLTYSMLKNIQELSTMQLLSKFPVGTSFKVTPEQALILEGLWKKYRKDNN